MAQRNTLRADAKRAFDKPVKITYKPKAKYPDPSICVQGTVTLRVEFLDTGDIGKITPVSGLGYGMTESAIDAAKQMKFEPAQLRGKPVTVNRTVQFSFTIY